MPEKSGRVVRQTWLGKRKGVRGITAQCLYDLQMSGVPTQKNTSLTCIYVLIEDVTSKMLSQTQSPHSLLALFLIVVAQH